MKYDADFFNTERNLSASTARKLVPVIASILHPQSVIDVGCGVGAYLAEFKRLGINDLQGVDGTLPDDRVLMVSPDLIMIRDLRKPLSIGRKYDLVLSIEVAEHLPSYCSDTFVDSLISLGDVVVFSAAIPRQRGTYHINEQWQDYWARKFANRGFGHSTTLREMIWADDELDPVVRQNIILYSCFSLDPSSLTELESQSLRELRIVHPELYLMRTAPGRLKDLIKFTIGSFMNYIAVRRQHER